MKAVSRHVEQLAALSEPPDVAVLPELWSTGYDLEQARALATPQGMREAEFLAGLALKYRMAFAGGSVLSLDGDAVRNQAQVINSRGELIASYDKIHLFRPMHEDIWLERGSGCPVFSLCGMRCACVICYDIRFPELARRIALAGAEMLFVSAEWPEPRINHWQMILKARAVENQMHVAACNRCGTEGPTIFGGRSMIIAADGTVLASAADHEMELSATLDPAQPSFLRNSFPVMNDRVPDEY